MDKQFVIYSKVEVDNCAMFTLLPSGTETYVDPLSLWNALMSNGNNQFVTLYQDTKDGRLIYVGSFSIDYQTDKFQIKYRMLFEEINESIDVQWNDFIQMTKDALSGLLLLLREGYKTNYLHSQTLLVSLEKINSSFFMLDAFFSKGLKRASEIKCSEFHFICPFLEEPHSDWQYDLPYKITIGEYTYTDSLCDYITDLEKLRFEIETYVFTGETDIHLINDTQDELIIRLKNFRTLANAISTENGVAFKYEDFTELRIIPDEKIREPACVCYTKGEVIINQLYVSLLNVAREGYRYEKDNADDAWECSPLTFYNKIKSLIIEDYLIGRTYNSNEHQKRQVIIKDVFTITPCICSTMYHDMDYRYSGLEDDDTIAFYDRDDHRICRAYVKGVYEWKMYFERNAEFADSDMLHCFDSEVWHKRGIEIAKAIRLQLPDEYDLWYGYPFEDVVHHYSQPKLIFNEKTNSRFPETE